MKKENIISVQEWLPFDRILENGIIQIKNKKYIKIIKVFPINFNLKSQLEKEAILNSYKIFLKTCSFDMQILIQSSKENLEKHISKIKSQEKLEKENIKRIAENYIQYIKNLNTLKKSSNKNFYIIIQNQTQEEIENIIIEELNDNYFKIKECLARCGNTVKDISNQQEIKELLFSFLNNRIFLQKEEVI